MEQMNKMWISMYLLVRLENRAQIYRIQSRRFGHYTMHQLKL